MVHPGQDHFEVCGLTFDRVHVGSKWQAIVSDTGSFGKKIYCLRYEDRRWMAHLVKNGKVVWYTRRPEETAAEAVQHVLDWEQQA